MILKLSHLETFISLARDRDTGRVFPDPTTGEPRLDYVLSDFDRENCLEGAIALSKLCYVSGATEIQPYVPGVEPFIASTSASQSSIEDGKDPEFADPAFAAWIQRVREANSPTGGWSSAHQMGTCRMGATAEAGVVDDRGKVWGKESLYVADASVFPSASGVNPMITTMAIADWVSRGIAKELTDSA